MDPRISRLSQMGPARSRSSVAASDTTYHSFHDVELFPPASPPRDTNKTTTTTHPTTPKKENQRPHPSSTEMKRQDSGYGSTPPRTSFNQPRRASTTSSSGSGPHTPRTRPCSRPGRPVIRRSPKSSPYPARPPMTQIQALHNARSQPNHPSGFFHFPAHPTDLTPPSPQQQQQQQDQHEVARSIPSPPPQSTHYWTSDRTRRLEYAAIDAAHQGLKGWVRRHLVPECFAPKEKTPVDFDDESGSVRRYRMELEEEEREGEKRGWAWARMKSW